MASSQPRILHDMRILITGVGSHERMKLVSLVKDQGAVLVETAIRNDPPHVIITRRVGTPKYFAALGGHGRSTPVVTPEWLVASADAGKRLPYSDFAAGPFFGLLICFSGLSVGEKARLTGLVSLHGGRHSPSLSVECTHLVTVSQTSDKYVFAKKHKMACLLPKWIEDSVAAGVCLQEQGYEITNSDTGCQKPETSTSLLHPSTKLRSADADETRADEGPSALFYQQQQQPQQQPQQQLQQQENISVNNNSASKSQDLQVRSTSDASHQLSGAQRPMMPSLSVWATLACEDSGTLFLDSCVLWPVGCTDEESIEIRKLCSESGAKMFWSNPHPTLITHIVAGSDIAVGSNSESVAQYLSERSSSCNVPVVNVDWLRRSVGRREPLPADERFQVSITHQRGQRQQTVDLDDPDLRSTINATEFGAKSSDISTSQKSLGFLDGCYFTLAAVKRTDEEGIAEQLIRAHGGRLFATKSGVPSGSRTFAICPPSLIPSRVRELRSSCADFDMVPESNRFTLYWLECSVMAKDLLKPQRGTPCFKPLPYPLPLPGMDRVSVSVSLYEASVRAAIQKTVEIVGGHVSLEFMSAKDSHLIVPLAKGEKYKACERLNIVAVTADWLVDSVTAGTLLPEEKYEPPLPPNGENISGEQKAQKQIENVPMKRPAPTNFLARQQIQGVGKRPHSLRERAARLSAAAGKGKELGKGFGSMSKQLCKSVVPLDLNTILTSTGLPERGQMQPYKRVDVQTSNKAEPAVPAVVIEKKAQNNEPSTELEAAVAMVSGYLASIPDGRGDVAANRPLPDLDTQLSPNAPNEKSPPAIDGMDMPGFHKQETEPLRRRSTRQKKKVADPVQDMDGSLMEMSQYIGYSEEPATLYAGGMSPGGSSELLGNLRSNAAAKEHLTRASSRLRNRKSWLESQPAEME